MMGLSSKRSMGTRPNGFDTTPCFPDSPDLLPFLGLPSMVATESLRSPNVEESFPVALRFDMITSHQNNKCLTGHRFATVASLIMADLCRFSPSLCAHIVSLYESTFRQYHLTVVILCQIRNRLHKPLFFLEPVPLDQGNP